MNPPAESHSQLLTNHDSFQALISYAESMQRLDVLESFRKEYIAACLVRLSYDPCATLDALVQAVDVDNTLREIERTMDQSLFIYYLKSCGVMVRGRDQAGRPILWLRAPRDTYNMRPNSPEARALLRALVWGTDIATLKSHETATGCLLIVDDRSRGILDFNLSLANEVGSCMLRRNPAENNTLVLFGAHPILRPIWKILGQVGVHFTKKLRFAESRDEVYDLVANHADIPEWWSGEGSGGQTANLYRNYLWEWERCLGQGDTTVRAKEIFNPTQPWEDIDEAAAEESGTANEDMEIELGTIPEGDENIVATK
jgi:hypothetical protein